MNSFLTLELYPAHHWTNWTGPYEQVLPYVRDAFGRSVSRLRESIPDEIGSELAKLVASLCDPDPRLRGNIRTRSQPGNPYALQRVVSEFDLLCRRAEVKLGKGRW